MLFTDGDFVTQADLQSIDSEVGKAKGAEGLVVEGDYSIIRRSIEEAGNFLKSRFQSFGGYMVGSGGSANHVAAVQNTGVSAISWPVVRLNQVVVSEPDPTKTEFKRWIMYSALEGFYRAVIMRRIDDRFEKKMNFYAGEATRAWSTLSAVGVPFVLSPLACPAAIREYNSGTWGTTNLSGQPAGSSEIGNTYDVVITWINSNAYVSPSQRSDGESAPSIRMNVIVAAGGVISVNISTLNPPTGYPDIGIADRIFQPMAATGWNIYAGLLGQTLYLQNSIPIPIATTIMQLPGVPVLSGTLMPTGQASNYNFAFQNMLQRA